MINYIIAIAAIVIVAMTVRSLIRGSGKGSCSCDSGGCGGCEGKEGCSH